jgi:hypothetical protein
MINKIYNGRISDTLRSLLLGYALAAGIGLSGATEAALAFSQPPANGNDAFSSISAEQAADDFSLASNGMVNGLTWWGSYDSDPAGLPADLFQVSFFQDDGSGNPATSPFASLTDTAIRTATGLLDATGETVYRYDLSVASPFVLTGGTPYYLSMVNGFDVNDPNANWYWLLSDTSGSNYYRFAANDPWQSDITGNLAFNVNVTGATTVPEPTNLWLFLMGSVLLGVVVKARKK